VDEIRQKRFGDMFRPQGISRQQDIGSD